MNARTSSREVEASFSLLIYVFLSSICFLLFLAMFIAFKRGVSFCGLILKLGNSVARRGSRRFWEILFAAVEAGSLILCY
jgi:hypothetical protein